MGNIDIKRRSSVSRPARQIQLPPPRPRPPSLRSGASGQAKRLPVAFSLPKFKLPKFKIPKLPRLPWKPIAASVLGIAVIASWMLIYLPKAAITVFARSEPVARDFELRVDPSLSAPSSADLAIPGKIIEEEISGEKQVAASGTKNVGKTASGFVSIYNFSKTTLILKAQTTTLTANGRKYRFTQDVGGIRPTALIGLEDQEVDETSLIPPAPTVATGPGEEFNLAAGTRLEITNEAFGAQPQLLYAVVAEGITGGSTKLVKYVVPNDIEQGLSELTTELTVQARAKILAEHPGIRISDNAFEAQTIEQHSAAQVAAEAEQFSVAARIKLRALTYEEADLRQVVFERVRRLLPGTKKLSEEATVLDAALTNVRLAEGIAMLQAHFEGEIKYTLNREDLMGKVRGKTVEEIREIFLSKPEIASLQVQLSPFWVKTAPKLAGRITLDVR